MMASYTSSIIVQFGGNRTTHVGVRRQSVTFSLFCLLPAGRRKGLRYKKCAGFILGRILRIFSRYCAKNHTFLRRIFIVGQCVALVVTLTCYGAL